MHIHIPPACRYARCCTCSLCTACASCQRLASSTNLGCSLLCRTPAETDQSAQPTSQWPQFIRLPHPACLAHCTIAQTGKPARHGQSRWTSHTNGAGPHVNMPLVQCLHLLVQEMLQLRACCCMHVHNLQPQRVVQLLHKRSHAKGPSHCAHMYVKILPYPHFLEMNGPALLGSVQFFCSCKAASQPRRGTAQS